MDETYSTAQTKTAQSAGERCDIKGQKVHLEKENSLEVLSDETISKWEFWAIVVGDIENSL